MFKIYKNNKYINMDLLFLLLLGERVNLKVTNRVKLVREFENLISYEESDSIYNNIKLDRFSIKNKVASSNGVGFFV